MFVLDIFDVISLSVFAMCGFKFSPVINFFQHPVLTLKLEGIHYLWDIIKSLLKNDKLVADSFESVMS